MELADHIETELHWILCVGFKSSDQTAKPTAVIIRPVCFSLPGISKTRKLFFNELSLSN